MIKPAVPEGWKRKDGNRAGNILERKRREEEDWKQELEKRWITEEGCLEFVESREDGLGTCGM